jgi:hypothetical protein
MLGEKVFGNELRGFDKKDNDLEAHSFALMRWRSNAHQRKSERDGGKVYSVLYSFRITFRVFARWRLVTNRDTFKSDLEKKIRDSSSATEKTIEVITMEKESAKQETEKLRESLEKERRKKDELIENVRNMFESKFKDLSVDITSLLSQDKLVKVSSSGLPIILTQDEIPGPSPKPTVLNHHKN